MKKLFNYLAVFTIFGGAFSINNMPFGESRIAYPIIILVFMAVLPFLKGLYFNRGFVIFFVMMAIFSLINVFIGKDTMMLFMKQFIGISVNAVFFYILVKINDCDVKKLFKVYLNVAFIIALMGVMQVISFKLGFKPGYDFRYFLPNWRMESTFEGTFIKVNSIMPEPWHMCNVMVPALFSSIASFFRSNYIFQKRWKGVVIIVVYFLSGSASGYFMAVVTILLLVISYRRVGYFVSGLLVVAILGSFIYSVRPDVKYRVDSSWDIVTHKAALVTRQTHLSAYTYFANMVVAYNSFKDSPIFGSGLGSHDVSYRRYKLAGKIDITDLDDGCRFDANSLFARLLSETGLFGILAFLVYILKFYVKKTEDRSHYLWIINSACLAMFCGKLFRMGHYFADGFFFFFWLYYFSKKLSENIREAKDVAYR